MNRGLVTASGVLSLCFGLFVSYQIGFVDGLLTSHPNWTPQ
jgi:high-affinity nickel-transport protein